jgi:hypothetical protein
MEDQIFSWGEPLANHLVSQALGKVLKTPEETLPSHIVEYLTTLNPSGSFGKTFRASLVRVEDGTLVPSSGRWQNSGMGSLTESLTLSTSEWPSDANVCSLSDVLETGKVQQRFFLSPRACEGILRRAEKRGKKLPPALELALKSQVPSQPETTKMQEQTE